ncbi:MAG: M3 family metallopeptidase [Acidobacteria bacterium]|nr:M3 family metallopeptidase [Acidobacteriota bacterium]
MKKFLILAVPLLLLAACSTGPNKAGTKGEHVNPFFETWNTPFGVPPFNKIKDGDYLPAFNRAIKEKRSDVSKIADNTAEPTFKNTIVALDEAGKLLNRVSGVFFNMISADTNDTLQEIAQEVSPKLSALHDDILMNEKLFKRVDAVYQKRDQLKLNPEQLRLVTETWKDFVRGGANLTPEKKAELKKINQQISLLELNFGENVRKQVNSYELAIDNKADLAGLPDSVVEAAAETAKAEGDEGEWIFTLNKPSLLPFLTYAQNRSLREKIFKAYINQCNHGGRLDNKANVVKLVNLRLKHANLLGYKDHASYVLEECVAKTPANVYKLLDKVWKPTMKTAKREVAEMQKIIDKEGGSFKLQPWDWWYYAEKVRKAKYDLDDAELRPYFELENVRKGAFMVANKLYGITFTLRPDLPVYQKDVKAYEVKDADGTTIGIYYADNFPRPSKRGGAWMDAYRPQHRENGKNIIPIVCNVTNFTKPTATTPSLLSLEEVTTLFHEFGHALHGLLSNCTYRKLAGTAVPRDFVEMPSQFMENWATDPQILKLYAKNYKTGKVIPDSLIEKIQNAGKFNQGFITGEYMAAAYLDMDWHIITKPFNGNPMDFEKKAMEKIHLIPEIVERYRSPYFRHAFAGGYDAGYYSYLWAAVLDADAFAAFKEHGLFDPATAKSFRDNVLSRGNTEDPMVLYRRFRGRDPKVDALLKRKGFM